VPSRGERDVFQQTATSYADEASSWLHCLGGFRPLAVACAARQTPCSHRIPAAKAGLGQEESMPSSGRLNFMSHLTTKLRRPEPDMIRLESTPTQRLSPVRSTHGSEAGMLFRGHRWRAQLADMAPDSRTPLRICGGLYFFACGARRCCYPQTKTATRFPRRENSTKLDGRKPQRRPKLSRPARKTRRLQPRAQAGSMERLVETQSGFADREGIRLSALVS